MIFSLAIYSLKLLAFFLLESILQLVTVYMWCVDDGSSLCCCWAEEERAADLLCLNEIVVDVCKGDHWTSHFHVSKKKGKTVGYCLQKLLKKHKKISVKKCGSLFDPLSLELKFSTGSKKKLTPEEESLLKILILDSCCGQVLVRTSLALILSANYQSGKATSFDIFVIPNIFADFFLTLSFNFDTSYICRQLLVI